MPPFSPARSAEPAGDDLHDQEAVVGGETHLIGEIGVDGDGANAERGTAHAA